MLLGWTEFRSALAGLPRTKFQEVGVQRIDLPFRSSELERVAAWLDDERQSGMRPLRPFHRLSTPERLQAWKERFDSLDLGEYDALVRQGRADEKAGRAAGADSAGAAHLSRLGFSMLLVEPNRFFPLHKLPNLEVVFCARGALYENRVLSSALLNRPREEAAELIDSGFPRFFRVSKRVGGTAFESPRYSVRQSYTLDEGAVLLVLWSGKHAILEDADNLMWDPQRCQNPRFPLACPDKTFEALARNSASSGNRRPAVPHSNADMSEDARGKQHSGSGSAVGSQ